MKRKKNWTVEDINRMENAAFGCAVLELVERFRLERRAMALALAAREVASEGGAK